MFETRNDEGLGDLPIWKVVPMALGAVICLLLVILATDQLSGLVSAPVPDVLQYSIIGLVATFLGVGIYARVVMRRSLRWFTFSDPDRSTLWWVGIGIALPAVATGGNFLVQSGKIIETTTDPSTVLLWLVGSIGIGL